MMLAGALKKTSVGLVFEGELSKAECSTNLKSLVEERRRNNFFLGDLLNHARDHHGERYLLAQEIITLEYQTLANIASVCKKVAVSRRRENLSFGHHETVAALPPADQVKFLRVAEEKQLSVGDLRMAIREANRAPEVAELIDRGCPRTDSEAARLVAWLSEGLDLLGTDKTRRWPDERLDAFLAQWKRIAGLVDALKKSIRRGEKD